ncbi:MAG: Uncharacterised protein [Hyphomonas sp. TMED17]|nr:MAG: Uncharacterised protein [Hyphomonas sp. TMED17]
MPVSEDPVIEPELRLAIAYPEIKQGARPFKRQSVRTRQHRVHDCEAIHQGAVLPAQPFHNWLRSIATVIAAVTRSLCDIRRIKFGLALETHHIDIAVAQP